MKTNHVMKWVLGFETSCDDTSVALVANTGEVLGCVSANQDIFHKPFGGVVPEIASRNHTLQILPLLDVLFEKHIVGWKDISGIAVTNRPGLIGSLLVGVVTAKTLALMHSKKLIGVNHLEGHLLAPFLWKTDQGPANNWDFPYLALAVSGGHTHLVIVHSLGKYEVLGQTVDDAAGEALDKFAKVLGLDFPGGAQLDRLAKDGNVAAFSFPRANVKGNPFDFSFSGIKASGVRCVANMKENEVKDQICDLAASYQEAVVDSLLIKLDQAQKKTKMKNIVITGGVSANSRLRSLGQIWAQKLKLNLRIPPIEYCTDNAAMIALAGAMRLARGEENSQDLKPLASSDPNDFYSAVGAP